MCRPRRAARTPPARTSPGGRSLPTGSNGSLGRSARWRSRARKRASSRASRSGWSSSVRLQRVLGEPHGPVARAARRRSRGGGRHRRGGHRVGPVRCQREGTAPAARRRRPRRPAHGARRPTPPSIARAAWLPRRAADTKRARGRDQRRRGPAAIASSTASAIVAKPPVVEVRAERDGEQVRAAADRAAPRRGRACPRARAGAAGRPRSPSAADLERERVAKRGVGDAADVVGEREVGPLSQHPAGGDEAERADLEPLEGG